MGFRTIAIVAIFIAAAAAIEEANSNDFELRKKLVDLQHRHVDWLLDHPDVIGVDVNHKSVGGKQTDQLSLVVWVREKLPESEVPEERRLPRGIEGFPVDVIEGEEAVGLNTEGSWQINCTCPTPTPTESMPTDPILTAQTPTLTPTPTPTPAPDCPCRDNARDLRGGHCIKIKNCPGDGTLGYFTKPKRGRGKLGILSNYHVTEEPDNRITSKPDQPLDDDDYVATVDTVSFNKFVDASHSEICGTKLPTPALRDDTVVQGTQNARCWDSVRFCGCISKCTDPGKVFSTNFCTMVTLIFKDEVKKRKFCNQILFTPRPVNGDSGSLLINTATNKSVGLVFAGNGIYGLANPIRTVLDKLGVTLA